MRQTKPNKVINRRKKSKDFTQIYNAPIHDLGDLAAVGLLTYLVSLPDDWEIYKTQLHKTFTRRTVDGAWKLLVEKNYAIDFSFYVKGNKGRIHIYEISDERYLQEDFDTIVRDTVKAYNDAGLTVNVESLETNNNYDFPNELFNVQNVQYKLCSTKRTTTNTLLTNTKKTNNNTSYIEDIDDKRTTSSSKHSEENIDVIISNFQEATKEDLSLHSFNTVLRKVMDKYNQGEIGDGKFRDYFATALTNKSADLAARRQKTEAKRNMATKQPENEQQHDPQEEYQRKVPFYNWLEHS
ncbi:MAG: hypothetical protein WAM95_22150 [Bacillus sp. (in: firmicutes)]